jgi:hypothetical protein
MDLFFWQIIFGKNRFSRALGYTQRTVDTFIRIDDKKIRAFTKTVNRTHIDTVGEFTFNTAFRNDIRHSKTPIVQRWGILAEAEQKNSDIFTRLFGHKNIRHIRKHGYNDGMSIKIH